ncbi:MAG: HEAT repeat domain-containing protein [Labilithrix sp.]|nr:HEAT repeat domain-containing protein [Labilithrix sp.]MCW5814870.1 HEAT repeat domain-containing protein [Labilithrix sp.]
MLGPPLLPRNLEASVRDLDSKKPETRAAAIEDLVRHARGDESVRARAVPLVSKRLEDEQPMVRAAAAVALGDLDATESVTSLLLVMEDDSPHVRQMAINALGEIADARALPRLRRALKDARPEVRYQSVIAFARVGDESGAKSEVDDAIFEASGDTDVAIAHIALRVAEERLDAGNRPEDRLLTRARGLADAAESSPQVALVAAILLAKAGDERGHALVARAVRGDKIGGRAAEKEDERAAVELAGELGMEDLVGHLERRTWGALRFVRDTCPFHARIALARMGHDRATKEILADLDSSKREVVEGAVVSAGRARLAAAKSKIERLTAAIADPELVREALEKLA